MSALLAEALFLSSVLPVFAAGLPEETLPPQTTEAIQMLTEETASSTLPQTIPAETQIPTAAATLPPETLPPQTNAPETLPPETTIPQTTAAPTQPPETLPEPTAAPTMPPETVPETTAAAETEPDPTLTTQAPTMPVEETTQPTEAPTLPTETIATEPTLPVTEPAQTQPPATEETQSPTVPTKTTLPTLPEETEAPTTAPDQPVQILTIAQAIAMAPGTLGITIQGTVVYAAGTMAVLQDNTGGIRLSFPEATGAAVPGEILRVTGRRTGGIAVEDFEVTGSGNLPVRKSTLADAPEALRVRITGAQLQDGTLTQNGISISLAAASAKAAMEVKTGRVDVWGVILDGFFYADAVVASAEEAADGEQTQQAGDWTIYFGQLHAHSTLSGGSDSPAELYAHASGLDYMDFFAITDHSDSFDNADSGSINDPTAESEKWTAGHHAALNATGGSFTGIYGFEMSWPKRKVPGHISTFNTEGWQAYTQAHMDTLEDYYAALNEQSLSVSQFNHPGHAYGEFYSFTKYHPSYDNVMHLLELDPGLKNPLKYYDMALTEGWHVAPSLNGGDAIDDIGSLRTAVLSVSPRAADLFEAIQNYRVYATTEPGLQVVYQLNGAIMGQTIGLAEPLTARVSLSSPSHSGSYTIDVIGNSGKVVQTKTMKPGDSPKDFPVPSGQDYYYLRISRDGQFVAATAPVWVDTYEDICIRDLSSTEKNPMEESQIYLSMYLDNQEVVPFEVTHLTCTANGTLVHEITDPFAVRSQDAENIRFSVNWPDPGTVKFQIKATGMVAGVQRTLTADLTLIYQAKQAAPSSIAQARNGSPGSVYRVRGYLTAGNDNPYTTFPDTLYLQDDTGGIAVVGYWEEPLQIGLPVEITGMLWDQDGNRVLKLTGYTPLSGTYYRHDPDLCAFEDAVNYSDHGGELMKVQGKVVSLTKTPDGKGVSRVTLQNRQDQLVTVIVESCIRSGSYGTNELTDRVKKGRTIQAIGLVHQDEYGGTVLRARNCDEFLYVPASLDLSNPQTGDPFFFLRFLFQ